MKRERTEERSGRGEGDQRDVKKKTEGSRSCTSEEDCGVKTKKTKKEHKRKKVLSVSLECSRVL